MQIQEWCISRNLKYGIKIKLCWCKGNIIKNPNYDCNCQNKVFDTWLSSALCTIISNEISNDKTVDLIMTGKDLVYFWIEKMLSMDKIFLSICKTNKTRKITN